MRQVPRYLIIGNGRVASHFQHYFSLLNLPYFSWKRNDALSTLNDYLSHATHVLLLISDQSIEAFAIEHLQNYTGIVVHFSGSLVTSLAHGAHPLMTFNNTLYEKTQYDVIPFVLDQNAPAFSSLLPGLVNTHVRLAAAQKAKYHALCVLSGNFSCLLWKKLFDSLAHEFHLSPDVAHPYLKQQMQNLLQDSASALTGPLVRNDHEMMANHLAALSNDPFQKIYQSFIDVYQTTKECEPA